MRVPSQWRMGIEGRKGFVVDTAPATPVRFCILNGTPVSIEAFLLTCRVDQILSSRMVPAYPASSLLRYFAIAC